MGDELVLGTRGDAEDALAEDGDDQDEGGRGGDEPEDLLALRGHGAGAGAGAGADGGSRASSRFAFVTPSSCGKAST